MSCLLSVRHREAHADPDGEAELAALKATIARFVESLLAGRSDSVPSYGKAEEVLDLLVEQLGVRDRLFLATKVGVKAAKRA